MNIKSFDINGQAQKAWVIDDSLLGKSNPVLLAQAVRVYTSNSHQKTSRVKTRGEVVGSTKKIYRQKGTGNARHGAKYTPIFVGGGIAHGPKGVRPANLSLPKHMRRRALASALLDKLQSGAISGLSGVKDFSGKTSSAVKLLSAIALHPQNSVLVVTQGKATPLYQAINNLQGVNMKRASLVNVLDLVSSSHLVVTKKALATITSRLASAKGVKTV